MLAIPEINLIVINTDAKKILNNKELQSNQKIIIRQRKETLCGDYTNINLIIEDDINAIPADLYLMTHSTNPLLSIDTIKQAITLFKNSESHDSLFTVNKVQTRFYHEDATPVNHDLDNLVRTQDLEVWYEENSCLYIFTKDSFTKTRSRIGTTPMMMESPRLESLDIDEPTDWLIAESVALYSLGSGRL